VTIGLWFGLGYADLCIIIIHKQLGTPKLHVSPIFSYRN